MFTVQLKIKSKLRTLGTPSSGNDVFLVYNDISVVSISSMSG